MKINKIFLGLSTMLLLNNAYSMEVVDEHRFSNQQKLYLLNFFIKQDLPIIKDSQDSSHKIVLSQFKDCLRHLYSVYPEMVEKLESPAMILELFNKE